MAVLPFVPGTSIASKLVLGLFIVVFGFFFVTVSSRIVGIIGSSSNPISGMTIATLMATAMVFVGVGWTGRLYEPLALVVGGMVCIAAANAGATSQDLKTGHLVGATPRAQQISLFVGVIASAIVIGLTVTVINKVYGIGTAKFPAPQGTLMATLIKGLLSLNLDWTFVLVGAFIAVTLELCEVKSLSFAVGLYLPLSTTLPIFVGGVVKGIVDAVARRKGDAEEQGELGAGSLFATGLVAGGAITGVVVAFLSMPESWKRFIEGPLNMTGRLRGVLGDGGFELLGVICFAIMALALFRAGRRPQAKEA
jgi:putative OPT family oligopeptide transporter